MVKHNFYTLFLISELWYVGRIQRDERDKCDVQSHRRVCHKHDNDHQGAANGLRRRIASHVEHRMEQSSQVVDHDLSVRHR